MAVQPAEQDFQRPLNLDSNHPRTAEIIPIRRPDSLELPVMEGVTEGLDLGNIAVPAFSFAIFDSEAMVRLAVEAAIRKADGNGNVLRGVMMEEKIAVSRGVKHPLYLANMLRNADRDAPAPRDSNAVAFEVCRPSNNEPFEIRYSAGDRNGDSKKDRKKHVKQYKKTLERLKRFLKHNLPNNLIREQKKEPLRVVV